MDLEPIRIELEHEQTWRQDELRFLRNQLASIEVDHNKARYRKSLVVMLYAHYEGFCKFALLQYIKVINANGVKCGEVSSAVAVGSLWKVFHAVEAGEKKPRIFENPLPEGDQLHRLARRVEFWDKISVFSEHAVKLDDDTIDTENNLWPIVLKKNLYKLGLDHEAFSHFDGTILKLLYTRNNIAHGMQESGIEEAYYGDLERAVFALMDSIMELVLIAVSERKYLRT